jgi:NADP-dependent 3-hydroxy acid dehydrogenase YdfG
MTRPALFVTGAAAGIGRAIAERFVAAGWRVGAVDVDASGLQELQRELGVGNVWISELDVTDAAAYAQVLSEFVAAAGDRLDLLVNNAGLVAANDFESIPLDRYHRLIDVNLKGVVNGCHVALPHLMKTRGARVINLCSASAIYGSPAYAVYSATKFAVRGFTEALDCEWARHGIAVMAVWPLFVNTAMVTGIDPQKSMTALGVRLTPQDIAATVWRAANRPRWLPRVHWLVGAQAWGLYLGTRLMPVWLNRLITRRLSGY